MSALMELQQLQHRKNIDDGSALQVQIRDFPSIGEAIEELWASQTLLETISNTHIHTPGKGTSL